MTSCSRVCPLPQGDIDGSRFIPTQADLRLFTSRYSKELSLTGLLLFHREDLGKSINTDEAAALGAVYQAAHLSKGFKVKKFVVKDANLYPIQVRATVLSKKDSNLSS